MSHVAGARHLTHLLSRRKPIILKASRVASSSLSASSSRTLTHPATSDVTGSAAAPALLTRSRTSHALSSSLSNSSAAASFIRAPQRRSLTASASASASTTTTSTEEDSPSEKKRWDDKPPWEVRVLFDGDCPLCVKEVNFLRAQDGGRGKLDLVDIAAEDYSPEDNRGVDFETAMSTIHGITQDGHVITGIEVFQRAYAAVGLG